MPEQLSFSDLRDLFAKANEEKSGGRLAGIAAGSERERIAAKRKLADLVLDEIVRQPLIDPDDDDASKLILESFDREAFMPIKSSTIGEFRAFLLDDATGEAELKGIQRAIIPEIAAAVTKIMSNKDLVLAAAKIRNVSGIFHPIRMPVQSNHAISETHTPHRIGEVCRLSFQAKSSGAGLSAWEISPATRPKCSGRL